MNSTKDAHELQKENSRDEQGARKNRLQTGQPLVHDAIAAQLWPLGSPSLSNLQDLNMQIQGSQKLPNEWCGECHVACRDKHMCIDKFESKSMYWKLCREHKHTWAGNEIASKVNIVKLII